MLLPGKKLLGCLVEAFMDSRELTVKLCRYHGKVHIQLSCYIPGASSNSNDFLRSVYDFIATSVINSSDTVCVLSLGEFSVT
ncbi:hypothetical protein TNCV_3449291 [Trichonephila clavipes]|nr:hypothetical protein TNCV_3449291 [Trichonephila clavipes]